MRRSVRSVAVSLAILALAPEWSHAADASTQSAEPTQTIQASAKVIKLPQRIPSQCVAAAAQRYQVPEMALLAILKQESGGRVGVIATNKNGSKDYGPAQFNDRSWGKYMQERYGITLDRLTNDMCQALMAQAYALRSEWNRCIKGGDKSIWCAIARYHSPTQKYQEIYVRNVWKQYQSIMARGEF